jgi:hypothetical protein
MVDRRSSVSVSMAKMSFTVPDEVRDRFEQSFRDYDQSAVVTGLLRLAVEAEERRCRSSQSLLERLRGLGEGGARPSLDPLRRTTQPRD